MINKIKQRLLSLEQTQNLIAASTREVEWAHIYHDSIRGYDFLEKVPIYPGRWAAGYSLLYVLVRVLSVYKPAKILEFGLGESSKIISLFIDNELRDTNHLILEQSDGWIEAFNERFSLSKQSKIMHLPLEQTKLNGEEVNRYEGFKQAITETYDLYVVDGPHGSWRYSRYDIVTAAELFTKDSQFIIIIDDTNRVGEKDTVIELGKLFDRKKIKYYQGDYQGAKSQTVIASEQYQFCLTF